MTGFERPGFGAKTIAFNIGGVASGIDDPAKRMVTFNGDGSLSDITAAAEVKAALGDTIGIGVAGLWNAGQPIQLAQLRVAGGSLVAELQGLIDGFDFKGDVAVKTNSIAAFSGIAGRDLAGALSLKASGDIMPLTGGFNLTLDGSGTDLAIGDELADRLLTGVVSLSGRVARDENGLTADKFKLGNDQLQVLADGSYSNALADFTFNLDLSDLALLSEEASGALKVVGTAKGAENVINLGLDASVATGTLSGRTLRDAALRFDGQYNVDQLTGTVSGDAVLDGFKTTLAANVGVNGTQQTLSNLDSRLLARG